MNNTLHTAIETDNQEYESSESVWEEKHVIRESLNETSEMKAHLPNIQTTIESLKKKWITVLYTADQRIESDKWLQDSIFIEATNERILNHLKILEEQLKKYPKWVTLPKEVVLWALIMNNNEYISTIRSIPGGKIRKFLPLIINKTRWFFDHSKPDTLYLSSWSNLQFSDHQLARIIHHELFHLHDYAGSKFDQQGFSQWPHITDYSSHSENEAQAEVARFLYNDQDFLFTAIQLQLVNFWKSSILEEAERITWCKINIDAIKQWNRNSPKSIIFQSEYTEQEYKKKYWDDFEYYKKWFPTIGIDHWNKLNSWSISLDEKSVSKKEQDLIRIYFQSLINDINIQIHNEWISNDSLFSLLQSLSDTKNIKWKATSLWLLVDTWSHNHSHDDIIKSLRSIFYKVKSKVSLEEMEWFTFEDEHINAIYVEFVNEIKSNEITFQVERTLDTTIQELLREYPINYRIDPLNPHYFTNMLDKLYSILNEIGDKHSIESKKVWIRLDRIILRYLRKNWNKKLTYWLSSTDFFETLNSRKKYKVKNSKKHKMNSSLIEYTNKKNRDTIILLTPRDYVELKYWEDSNSLAYKVLLDLASAL